MKKLFHATSMNAGVIRFILQNSTQRIAAFLMNAVEIDKLVKYISQKTL
jgi:hypothetical protein